MFWRVRRLHNPRAGIGAAVFLIGMLSACAGSPNSDSGPRGRRGEGAVLTFEVPQDDQDADVFVDGNYVGQVSEVQGAVRVAPGKHRVEVRKPGRFPIQKTIKVEASRREQTRQVRGELLANPLDS